MTIQKTNVLGCPGCRTNQGDGEAGQHIKQAAILMRANLDEHISINIFEAHLEVNKSNVISRGCDPCGNSGTWQFHGMR